MLIANLEAELESKKRALEENRKDIKKLEVVINNMRAEMKRLLERDTDLYYEITELEEKISDSGSKEQN